MKLLREMEDEAKKLRKLRWSDELHDQFDKLVVQVFNDLQSLYFLVEGGTVRCTQTPWIMQSADMCARSSMGKSNW